MSDTAATLDEVVSIAKAETARLRRKSETAQGLDREETTRLRDIGALLIKVAKAQPKDKPPDGGAMALADIAEVMKNDPEVLRVLGLNDGESIEDAVAALRAQRRGKR